MKKTVTSLVLGSGLLFLPLQGHASPNGSFWTPAEEEKSNNETSDQEFDELWGDAQEEAEKADEDNRTEEQKLEDFDQQWDSFGNNNTGEDTSNNGFGLLSGEMDGFGAFNQLWNSISSSKDNEDSNTEEESINPTSSPSFDEGVSTSTDQNQEPSSFDKKWNQFGEKFDSTYEGENDKSYEWEESFDSSTGTYERSN
ncbi:hypothetical protein D7Z54_07160 [Salibacterium salarium]|uniref:Uncharacterized protein n=1 Tax=Salibacterium salarium TaxID=284579 RepID=A0A428N5Z6_9BACI|nr:hypothetical protein [Salibacterium salarium]RSL33894.1 hypothetical protein D7Z54_07160 [Salibacterium salarium]